MEVEDTVAQADNVVVRWRAHGVHRGQELGMPVTGETLDFWGITWLRFSNGQIVEGWMHGTRAQSLPPWVTMVMPQWLSRLARIPAAQAHTRSRRSRPVGRDRTA
jgi:hypothetical protein